MTYSSHVGNDDAPLTVSRLISHMQMLAFAYPLQGIAASIMAMRLAACRNSRANELESWSLL